MEWDRARIEQAMSNLLANAVQHGDGNVVVDISAAERNDQVLVSVRNHGQPIWAERLPYLFEPFENGDNSPAGLGLGLFIVREIVHAHRGAIDVSSSHGGTTFTIRLPRREPPIADARGASA